MKKISEFINKIKNELEKVEEFKGSIFLEEQEELSDKFPFLYVMVEDSSSSQSSFNTTKVETTILVEFYNSTEEKNEEDNLYFFEEIQNKINNISKMGFGYGAIINTSEISRVRQIIKGKVLTVFLVRISITNLKFL